MHSFSLRGYRDSVWGKKKHFYESLFFYVKEVRNVAAYHSLGIITIIVTIIIIIMITTITRRRRKTKDLNNTG